MSGRRLDRRADAVAETIAQHDGRSDQVRPAVGSLGGAAVTVDAVLRVDRAPPCRRRGVDLLAFVRTSLRGQCRVREDDEENGSERHFRFGAAFE